MLKFNYNDWVRISGSNYISLPEYGKIYKSLEALFEDAFESDSLGVLENEFICGALRAEETLNVNKILSNIYKYLAKVNILDYGTEEEFLEDLKGGVVFTKELTKSVTKLNKHLAGKLYINKKDFQIDISKELEIFKKGLTPEK